MQPFSQGHINSLTLHDFILAANNWNDRISLTTLAIICIVYSIAFLQNKKVLKMAIFELYLVILCTNLFPWKLLNRVPLINNLQHAEWRFGIWLSIIPIIMIILNFKGKIRDKSLYIFAILSLLNAVVLIKNGPAYMPRLNDANANIISSVKSSYSHDDITLLKYVAIRDYYPKAKGVLTKKDHMTRSRLAQVYHQAIIVKGRRYPIAKNEVNNGVNIILNKDVKHNSQNKIVIPVLGYKSLNYRITVNNRKVKNGINRYGYIFIRKSKLVKGTNINIKYDIPQLYYWITCFSLIIFLFIIFTYIHNAFDNETV